VALAACTPGDERARPTTSPVPPTLGTLPLIGTRTYPDGSDEIVVQISSSPDGRREWPLLTVYGDLRAIALDGDDWSHGQITDFQLQTFLDGADAAGLLRSSEVLRNPASDAEHPDITVLLRTDGRRIRHEYDLARIEWPAEPRAFLQRAVSENVFDLTSRFSPDAWISCPVGTSAADGCSLSDHQEDVEDRPVLPHEDPDELTSDVDLGSS
jgi:hypothetical protein